MRTKIDHWMMFLPDFLPTSGLKCEVWEIENCREEINIARGEFLENKSNAKAK